MRFLELLLNKLTFKTILYFDSWFSSRNDNITPVFNEDDIRWTNINEEVDVVTPMIIFHLQKLRIEHFQLPDIKEYICIVSFS